MISSCCEYYLRASSPVVLFIRNNILCLMIGVDNLPVGDNLCEYYDYMLSSVLWFHLCAIFEARIGVCGFVCDGETVD